jgi:uncharacterized protein (TIGR02246 family)
LISGVKFDTEQSMRKTHLLLPVGLVLALAGCSSAPPAPAVDVAAEEAKIRELEAANVKNWAAKDVDKLLAFYAEDATLMAAGMPAMKGKAAMKPVLQMLLADPNLKLEYSAQRVEIAKSGDVAFSQGTYQMMLTDPKTKKTITDKGSYVTGYRKQADGSWKAVSDINVSELPPAGAS